MKLRHLRVERFRGIKELDWLLGGDFLCLVGPGDVGKSTILDAIEYALSPRWNLPFDDSDFYGGDTTGGLLIETTIGDLPRRLMSDAHFGLRIRGLGPDGSINDEPADDDEHVLTLRLSVDASLEPKWEVVTERHPEGGQINANERERLGLVRLGSYVERDLSWSRGSVLSRLTGDADEHARILADAGRHARTTVDKTNLPKLSAASQNAQELASAFGVLPRDGFEPRLDAGTATLGQGGLTLHDGSIPVRRSGLGTRRLVTLAVQRHVARDGGVVLVDELEHGLEPFRVRRLLAELMRPSVPRPDPAAPTSESPPKPGGLVLLTTHSPVVLRELDVNSLRVVRSTDGSVKVLAPADTIQPIFKDNPEAFLSRRVVVCEGKTEVGLLRGLDDEWTKSSEPFAAKGVALADGGGCKKAGKFASALASLGYEVAVVADSDQPLDVDPAELSRNGVHVTLWAGGVALERRVLLDLPWPAVVQAIMLAIGTHGEDLVRSQVASAFKGGSKSPKDLPANILDWSTSRPEQEIREALATASLSKEHPWFKRVDLAVNLGRVVAAHLGAIPDTDLARQIDALRTWIFCV